MLLQFQEISSFTSGGKWQFYSNSQKFVFPVDQSNRFQSLSAKLLCIYCWSRENKTITIEIPTTEKTTSELRYNSSSMVLLREKKTKIYLWGVFIFARPRKSGVAITDGSFLCSTHYFLHPDAISLCLSVYSRRLYSTHGIPTSLLTSCPFPWHIFL